MAKVAITASGPPGLRGTRRRSGTRPFVAPRSRRPWFRERVGRGVRTRAGSGGGAGGPGSVLAVHAILASSAGTLVSGLSENRVGYRKRPAQAQRGLFAQDFASSWWILDTSSIKHTERIVVDQRSGLSYTVQATALWDITQRPDVLSRDRGSPVPASRPSRGGSGPRQPRRRRASAARRTTPRRHRDRHATPGDRDRRA